MTSPTGSSPERMFKRMSLHQPDVSSQPMGPTAARKKMDAENRDIAPQRDLGITGQGTGRPGMERILSPVSETGAAPPPLSIGASNTHSSLPSRINNANSSSNTSGISQPARNTPPTRTPLGSILAATFGPSSPNSIQSFKYPQTSSSSSSTPTFSSPSPLASAASTAYTSPLSTPNVSISVSEKSTKGPPTRKMSSMSDKGSMGGNKSNSFRDYTPSVIINIGKASTSLPQILMPKKRVAQDIASNLTYIGAWYFFSTALSIYNKNLMGKDNWNFNLPLFVSSVHAGLHFVITACLMHFWPDVFDATRSGKGGRLTIHNYVTQVVPCAVAAALEICMANASLMYITLSFYTMIKSSTPIWVLVFAFIFRLEKPRMSLVLIIGVIVMGVVLTVAGETQFDMTGFLLVLFASVMSGLRWSLTQMLLQKDQLGMDNPVATLYYISPIMFVLMSILSLVIEDPFVQFASSEFFDGFQTGMLTLAMAAGGGLLAFAMTVAEFKLIKNTGTVTLSVAGISKEIVVISLSMLIFGDRLTFVNLLGLLVSIGGIMAYNYVKIRKLQQNSLGSGDYEVLGSKGRHHKGDNTD
ncbi:Triose-phosphate Transporter [Haplosporangium sp. Z 767]|nr:Triose-phosphate Transporter [Haplosporangium sp. Z 767]